jgi:pimeloyl-ACP methyl ester carboxylesterase
VPDREAKPGNDEVIGISEGRHGRYSGKQKAGNQLKRNFFARSCVGLCLLGVVNHTMSAQADQASAPVPNTVAPSKALTRDTVAGYIDANQKIVTTRGIEEKKPVKINGIEQWLSIRGRDKDNPVLLYLHGGPGAPFMPLSWTVESPWEDYFTVVQWDQRGAGKTYASNDPKVIEPSMTIPQMTSDTVEVVRYLREHLHKRKIIVVGHSWGSVLGVALAQQHPEWLYAYVGVGQYVSSQLNEEAGYRYDLDQARASKNLKAEQELMAIAPYPGNLDELDFEKIGVERKWLTFFGGVVNGRQDQSFEDGVSTISPAYSQHDLDAADEGGMFSITHLIRPLLHVDYTTVTNFTCPVFIFAGRHDYATSHDLAYQWFTKVKAPTKHFVWFENSGHLIPEEEPGRFLYHLVTDVRPLALKEGDGPAADLTMGLPSPSSHR